MKNVLFILTFSLFGFSLAKADTVDSLLLELDNVLENSAIYEQQKVQRIASMKKKIGMSSLTIQDTYYLHKALYREYESYICDSALHYINRNIDIARQINNEEWLVSSQLNKASVLITSGLYVEAMELLKSLSKQCMTQEDLLNYYVAYSNIYLYLAEYTSPDYEHKYIDYVNQYSDSIINLLPVGSHQYVISRSQILMNQEQYEKALDILLLHADNLEQDTHEYAVTTSILAFVYHLMNDKQKETGYRILSAIADIKAVVTESYSLCALAELLFREGELERANRYIKSSLEMTNRYKARLRSLQVSNILPLIDRSWQEEINTQQKQLFCLIVTISLLAVVLLVAIAYVIGQMKKIRKARQEVVDTNTALKTLNVELSQLNNALKEANSVKEEYLGCFLQLCSTYIDKLDTYRRTLNKKAAAGKMNELYDLLKSKKMMDEELKDFYHNFDASFLKIFPKFIEEFNGLLPEEEQIIPKKNELLTTELRIFALVRLGITDSTRIASFLRYSITTIYTYRSKMKNKSLHKDDFEERIMKISSFR